MTAPPPSSPLFNSDVETAIRVLVLLDAMHPRRCNIAELTWFDYVVVNSGQFDGGPPSLHPQTEVVTGELLVRRHTIQRALRLLQLQHLVDETHEPVGITYAVSPITLFDGAEIKPIDGRVDGDVAVVPSSRSQLA